MFLQFLFNRVVVKMQIFYCYFFRCQRGSDHNVRHSKQIIRKSNASECAYATRPACDEKEQGHPLCGRYNSNATCSLKASAVKLMPLDLPKRDGLLIIARC